MAAQGDIRIIEHQVGRILASGVLGRSRFYVALLEYLRDCSRRGHAPKEIEIAADVFNRGNDFDPSQDSMVRVYAHNLRQKLQQYYAEHGDDESPRIAIPKGEYRIAVVELDEPAPATAAPPPVPDASRPGRAVALAAAVCLAVGIALGFIAGRDTGTPSVYAGVADSALWAALAEDELPVTLAVGDYYILGERDQYGNVVRMVREFDINSSRDLDDHYLLDPEAADRYLDLDLTYLPTSTAFAMRDLMSVLFAMGRDVRVVAMSNLDTAVLRESHIVYVGYLSGLGMISDFFFPGSELAIGSNYDELVHVASGETFVSEAGLPSGPNSYRDYGLFANLKGPTGNRFIIVAGMRDEGLMQTAQAVSNPALVPESLEALAADSGAVPESFELLYEVAGFERTNLNDKIVHTAALAP